LAEQAKILFAEAEENNLSDKVKTERFERWYACSLCEQEYHGVVRCALGWACWKTYVGRPETDEIRGVAMNVLGNGLISAKHYEDALTVQEAELSMLRRVGAPEHSILVAQTNLSTTYARIGRHEQALQMSRDVYSGELKLYGEEHGRTVVAACNYATSLVGLERFEEAKSLLRKMIPVAQRILGDSHDHTLSMRSIYANALYQDTCATLDDLSEAVTTFEDTARIARRVLGGAHPSTVNMERALQHARAALRARDTPQPSSPPPSSESA